MNPSAILEVLQNAVSALARRSYPGACVGICAVALALTGIGTVPHEPYRLTALNPFAKSPVYDVNTFQESPLLPLLAHVTRLTAPAAFAALCLAFGFMGLVVIAGYARKELETAEAIPLFALVVGHPAVLILMSWVGTPDPITFLFEALFLFVSHPLALLLISAVGAFNHPLVVFGAPAVLVLRWLSGDKRIGRGRLAFCAAGLVVGTIAVQVFLSSYGIEVFSRLDYLRTLSLVGWIKHNLSNLPAALYSLNGVSWLAIAVCVTGCFRLDPKYYSGFLVAQALFLGMAFFSIDTTRVYALASWPTVVHCIVHSLRLARSHNETRLGGELRGAMAGLGLLSLLGPRYYVWDDAIHGPPFAESYLALAQAIRGMLGGD